MRIHHDPEASTLASADDIKQARVRIESLPILCSDGAVFEADADSLARMSDIADLLQRTGEAERWRMADNSERVLTGDELAAYVDEIRQQSAERLRNVFRQYRALRESPDVTLRDLREWEGSFRT